MGTELKSSLVVMSDGSDFFIFLFSLSVFLLARNLESAYSAQRLQFSCFGAFRLNICGKFFIGKITR